MPDCIVSRKLDVWRIHQCGFVEEIGDSMCDVWMYAVLRGERAHGNIRFQCFIVVEIIGRGQKAVFTVLYRRDVMTGTLDTCAVNEPYAITILTY